MDEAATRRRPRARRGGGGDDDDDDDDAFENLFEEEGRLFSFDSDADVDGDVVANETSSSGRARVSVGKTADDDLRTNDSTTTPIGGLVAGSWPTTQRLLLARGAALCRPDGGALIYATCSMLEAENQDVARWFERRFGGGGGGEDAPLPEATGSNAAASSAPSPSRRIRSRRGGRRRSAPRARGRRRVARGGAEPRRPRHGRVLRREVETETARRAERRRGMRRGDARVDRPGTPE